MEQETDITTVIVWAKTIGYFAAAISFDYLGIPSQQMSILGALMVLDFITGVCKVYKVNPVLLTSHTAWLGVIKKFLTIVIVYTIALMGMGVHINVGDFMSWSFGILITAETYSILQNIYAFNTGKVLPEYDVISILLKKVGKIMEAQIEIAVAPSTKDNKK